MYDDAYDNDAYDGVIDKLVAVLREHIKKLHTKYVPEKHGDRGRGKGSGKGREQGKGNDGYTRAEPGYCYEENDNGV